MEQVLTRLFTLKNAMQIFHWQTKSFAKHKASDFFNKKFSDLLDSMVESYLGYGRDLLFQNSNTIPFTNVGESMILNLMEASCNMLLEITFDPDVNNIKDELIAVINKTRYLLSLK